MPDVDQPYTRSECPHDVRAGAVEQTVMRRYRDINRPCRLGGRALHITPGKLTVEGVTCEVPRGEVRKVAIPNAKRC